MLGQASSFYTDFFFNNSTTSKAASPSPFLDVSQSRMPADFKKIFPLLEWYATMDSVIAPVLSKISEYPIMPLDYSEVEDDKQRLRIRELLEDFMDIRTTLTLMSIDYNTYGNGFSSIYFPFIRYFQCRECGHIIGSDRVKEYEIKKMEFYFKCQKCGNSSKPKKYGDWPVKNPEKTKFLIWRPHDIEIVSNSFSGQSQYYYNPPKHMVDLMETGNKFILDGTPKFILEALSRDQIIRFNPGEIFHMRRPTMSRDTRQHGWGQPLIISCLSQAYLKKVFSKASEVTGILRSAPASIIYPETNTSAGALGNPLMATNISDFQDFMKRELLKHRRDPGYIMTAPHPVGQTVLFGDSKAYNYYQEIKYQDQQILEGMGVPREFLEGGLQFTGSSISLRILENQLFKQVKNCNDFIRWSFKKISTFFSLGDNEIKMKKFKMADDMQMLQLQLQAAEQGDLSKRRIWEGVQDIDFKKEMVMIEREDEDKRKSLKKRVVAETEVNLEAQKMQMRFEQRQQVQAQLEQFKEQARLYKKDPSYATMLNQQAALAQQQIEMQQQAYQAMEMEQKQKDVELKDLQQTRLAIKDGLASKGEMSQDPLDQIQERNSKLDKLVNAIMDKKGSSVSILDDVLRTSPELYKEAAARIVGRIHEIEDPDKVYVILGHLQNFMNSQGQEQQNAQLT
jgi:hypothetical protein